MNWLLPEYLADALPAEAARIERLRRTLLDVFRVHGYEFVIPPLLEYLESLLTGSGQDLKLRTFKLVDQLSGRTLGVRADMTPQVARIDAHLLNRDGVVRLCYCDSVLHTLPASLHGTREPIQLGAELYGYAGLEGDREIIRLLATVLDTAGVPATRIDLSHFGIFTALAEAARLSGDRAEEVFSLLQGKDVPGLAAVVKGLPAEIGAALLALPNLYGGREVLDEAARILPDLPAVAAALADLRTLADTLPGLPLSFDLADLRGYHYHNGVVFAVYTAGVPSAVAHGGRYDGVGSAFGRARPATGFSLDLRELARHAPTAPQAGAILAPYAGDDAGLAAAVAALRRSGETVIELLPGETAVEGVAFDRRIARVNDSWILEPISKD